MGHIQIKSELIEQLIEISKEAGKAILEVYNTNFDYQIKEDLSPLTKADTLSHNIICEKLKLLTPDIPILSEESSDIPFNIRSLWKQYWLVDPLDGTKEFINKNGEFTVNIALIKNNKPILGIIHAPFLNETYWGSSDYGSFSSNRNNEIKKLKVSEKIKGQIQFVASRSHKNKRLNLILNKFDSYELIHKGSSLKFCLVASGRVDIYPRLGPTSEWDIAAGEAIVKFAGGHIIAINQKPIHYNCKNSYINPSFVVSNSETLAGKFLSLIE